MFSKSFFNRDESVVSDVFWYGCGYDEAAEICEWGSVEIVYEDGFWVEGA